MMRCWEWLLGKSHGPDDDESKAQLEQKIRELDDRSNKNRKVLTEIQVAVLARRTDGHV